MLKPSRALSLYPLFRMGVRSRQPRVPYQPFQAVVAAVAYRAIQDSLAFLGSRAITPARAVIRALAAIQDYQATAASQDTQDRAYRAFLASQALVYQATQGKAAFQASQGSLDSQDSLAFQVTQGLVSRATQALAFLVTRDSQVLAYQAFQDSLAFLAAQDFPAFLDSLVFLATQDQGFLAIQGRAYQGLAAFQAQAFLAFQV